MPKQVTLQRKKFKQLVDKLIQAKIRFRWEIPRGVSFPFENKRWWIKTEEEMQEFIATKWQGSEISDNRETTRKTEWILIF